MEIYFKNKERKDRLLEVLESWRGTPYRHHTGVKGLGVDCAYFVGCVLKEVGVIEQFDVPEYPIDFHMHIPKEIYVQHFRNHPLTIDVGFKNPIDGDILIYKYGKIASHSAIYFDNYTWQPRARVGVEKFHISQGRRRLKYGFRLVEL